jgi:hypothetical protein
MTAPHPVPLPTGERGRARRQVLGMWCLLYTLEDLLKFSFIWEAR